MSYLNEMNSLPAFRQDSPRPVGLVREHLQAAQSEEMLTFFFGK